MYIIHICSHVLLLFVVVAFFVILFYFILLLLLLYSLFCRAFKRNCRFPWPILLSYFSSLCVTPAIRLHIDYMSWFFFSLPACPFIHTAAFSLRTIFDMVYSLYPSLFSTSYFIVDTWLISSYVSAKNPPVYTVYLHKNCDSAPFFSLIYLYQFFFFRCFCNVVLRNHMNSSHDVRVIVDRNFIVFSLMPIQLKYHSVSMYYICVCSSKYARTRASQRCDSFSAPLICSESNFYVIFFFFFSFLLFICYRLYVGLNRCVRSYTIELTVFVVWWWWYDCYPVILPLSHAPHLHSFSFMIGQLSIPNSLVVSLFISNSWKFFAKLITVLSSFVKWKWWKR